MELAQALKDFADLVALIPFIVLGLGFAAAFIAAIPHLVRERAATRARLEQVQRCDRR